MSKPILLLVDDNQEALTSLTRLLKREYDVRCATTQAEALQHLAPPPDIALLDMRLKEDDPDNREGIALLEILHQQFPDLPVLMHTAHGDVNAAVECVRLGAVDFIEKPRADITEITARLTRALEQARLRRRVTNLEQELNLIEPRQIIGASRQMLEVKQAIEAVASDGYVTVLIEGESGTGKELVARALHATGWRQSGPFLPVVLASLSPALIEGELFGYESGAFTDARRRHIGYLERAKDGLLFLDEIGELELPLQVKLLRFLEEREFQRLSGNTSIKVDVQVVAATNSDLRAEVKSGRFREDLYFRLKGFEIKIPPLRERPEDIPLLVDHFLHLFHQQGRKVLRFSPQAMDRLLDYPWPGNIRELRTTMESALFRAFYRRHLEIEEEDLPPELIESQRAPDELQVASVDFESLSLDEALAKTELAFIERALQQVQGKKTEAWKLLGLNDRFALLRRVKKIADRYPHLINGFSFLKNAYHAEIESSSAVKKDKASSTS